MCVTFAPNAFRERLLPPGLRNLTWMWLQHHLCDDSLAAAADAGEPPPTPILFVLPHLSERTETLCLLFLQIYCCGPDLMSSLSMFNTFILLTLSE